MAMKQDRAAETVETPALKPTAPAHRAPTEHMPLGLPHLPLDAPSILQLQRTIGNAAISALLAQRAGEPATVTTPAGTVPAAGAAGTTTGSAAAAPTPDPTKLSGKQWKDVADEKWTDSSKLDDLDSGFKGDLDKFLEMLTANNISTGEYTTKRPKERAYLLHYAVEVKNGTTKPKDVPKQDGVDIIWDHGDDAKSVAAAKEMVEAFGIVGPAALISNHIAGKAIDMKFDFTKNTKDGVTKITYKKDGKDVERTLKIDDEAVIGVKAAGKSIASISQRELSKAGEDFGVKRHIDNDIVHWSTTGT